MIDSPMALRSFFSVWVSECGEHGVCESLRPGSAADVARQRGLLGIHLVHRVLNAVRRFSLADVVQHEDGGL